MAYEDTNIEYITPKKEIPVDAAMCYPYNQFHKLKCTDCGNEMKVPIFYAEEEDGEEDYLRISLIKPISWKDHQQIEVEIWGDHRLMPVFKEDKDWEGDPWIRYYIPASEIISLLEFILLTLKRKELNKRIKKRIIQYMKDEIYPILEKEENTHQEEEKEGINFEKWTRRMVRIVKNNDFKYRYQYIGELEEYDDYPEDSERARKINHKMHEVMDEMGVENPNSH